MCHRLFAALLAAACSTPNSPGRRQPEGRGSPRRAPRSGAAPAPPAPAAPGHRPHRSAVDRGGRAVGERRLGGSSTAVRGPEPEALSCRGRGCAGPGPLAPAGLFRSIFLELSGPIPPLRRSGAARGHRYSGKSRRGERTGSAGEGRHRPRPPLGVGKHAGAGLGAGAGREARAQVRGGPRCGAGWGSDPAGLRAIRSAAAPPAERDFVPLRLRPPAAGPRVLLGLPPSLRSAPMQRSERSRRVRRFYGSDGRGGMDSR